MEKNGLLYVSLKENQRKEGNHKLIYISSTSQRTLSKNSQKVTHSMLQGKELSKLELFKKSMDGHLSRNL